MTWVEATFRYSPEHDAVELVQDGDVVVRIPRNRVIEMVCLLPPDPPKEKPPVSSEASGGSPGGGAFPARDGQFSKC